MNNELSLPVPVIIVEDEPLIQKRLTDILINLGYSIADLRFAQSLAQAKEQLSIHSASFALVDLNLPDGNGIEFISTLNKYDPTIPILVISAWSTEDAIFNALSSGATGYVLKERDDLEITFSIRSILRGGAPIDPFIAQKILKQLHKNCRDNSIMVNFYKQSASLLDEEEVFNCCWNLFKDTSEGENYLNELSSFIFEVYELFSQEL